MNTDQHTYATLAEALSVSVPAIKSWRRKFPGALPLVTRGKPLRFAPEALAACTAIRDGYARGLSTAEVREKLEHALVWMGAAPGGKPPSGAGATGRTESTQESGAVQALAQTMAELLEVQRRTASRLERLEQRLEQMHGHPQLLQELRALKCQAGIDLEAKVEERTAAPEKPATQEEQVTPPQEQSSPEPRAAAEPAVEEPQSAMDGTAAPGAQSMEQGAPGGRVVRIRNRDGGYERYVLRSLGPDPDEAALRPPEGDKETISRPGEAARGERVLRPRPQPRPEPTPPDEFLDLPVVAKDDKGDYLGVPGLTVRILAARLGPGCHWQAKGELWLLELPTLPAQILTLTPTVTPRGNRVAALTRLATSSGEADAGARIALLRSLRK